MFLQPAARSRLSAKDRRRAKTSGSRRIREASSAKAVSRTWWLPFSMRQWARIQSFQHAGVGPAAEDTQNTVSRVAAGPRAPQPGAPYTYVTTKEFLAQFGFDTLRDLPDMEALAAAACSARTSCWRGLCPKRLAMSQRG